MANEFRRHRAVWRFLHLQTNAWPIADLFMLLVMWTVMMVAMMVPSAAPMVLVFAALNRKRRAEDRPYVPTGLFLLGYLAVWTGFSAMVTIAQWGLHRAALLSPGMVSTSPIFGGVLLIAAGIFQFTSWKHACLKHCRTPLHFLMTGWREGYVGAWKMGLEHGLQCTVCCWLLMALLFVAGVMNLLWVATISIFVLIEKIAPSARWVTRIGGVLSVGWGVWLILHR